MSKELEANANLSHYRILEKIGAGGMGEVYLAQDTKLDRKVALKILPSEFAEDKDRMSRFVREARSASALNHPNIITIYEIGESNGTHFIATEFIDGKTLNEYAKTNSLNYKLVLEIAIQVASALDEAHAAGIVHRDIKPDNVMIRENGLVKILDFGIAKLSAPPESDAEAATAIKSGTTPGMIIGTANYMSPEQAKGKEVDARTDIFSFGVVLYEMISGHLPFEGETAMEMIGAILHKEPKPLDKTEVPLEIEKIISKCLRKDSDERYQTIKDVCIDLKDVKQELELKNLMERIVSPDKPEPKTQMLKATTVDEINRTTTNQTVANNPKTKYLAAGLLTLLLAIGGFFGYKYFTPTRQIESIAVMPFVNESGNSDVEYLSDGMTETLIGSLSNLPNLSVKPRSSVFRYKGKETNPQTIAKELNVQAILNGRVVQRGNDITLYIELIDAQKDTVLWKSDYNRQMSNLVSLQSEIALDVSTNLKIKLSGADQAKVTKNYTNDPEAYRLYLQGLFYSNMRAGKLFDRAEGYFKQAIERDPNFALAYAGLAASYGQFERPKAKEYIMRALALDNQLSEAHSALGYQLLLDYDFAASERELKRAIELNPNNAIAYQVNGSRLMMLGRYDESLASFDRAIEIEPTLPDIRNNRAACLVASGKIDEGIESLKKAIELDPTFVWNHSHLSFIYRLKGEHAASVEERARASDLLDQAENAKRLRTSFANGGWSAYLREIVRQNWGNLSTSQTRKASFLAELGEKEDAISWLQDGAAKGDWWLFSIKYDPAFDGLRGDPRFQQLLKKFEPPK